MSNKVQLIDILTKSRKIFFHFIDECNKNYRSGHDLKLYRKIIKLHEETNDINSLLNNKEFHKLIYETLKKWNMNQKGAKLTTFDNFSNSIIDYSQQLKELYKHKLHSLNEQLKFEVLRLLKKIFTKLDVMRSKRRIVGGSKTLHFLLPDLVMPIDSKYTMTYFYGYNKYSDKPEKEFEDFKDIFIRTCRIVKKLNLNENDVKGEGWNTSVPKVIDNAVIGFNRYFENSVIQFRDEAVKNIMSLLEDLTEFNPQEKSIIKLLLQKQKNKLELSKIKKIKEQLLIKKAIEAGITVSEEEINTYLAKKRNNLDF